MYVYIYIYIYIHEYIYVLYMYNMCIYIYIYIYTHYYSGDSAGKYITIPATRRKKSYSLKPLNVEIVSYSCSRAYQNSIV